MTCLLYALLFSAGTAATPSGTAVFALNRIVEPGETAAREAVHRPSTSALVRPIDTRLPPPVKRGDSVVILIRSGPLSISGQGRALSGGAVGEQVRVISDATHRTLQAVVEGPGRVQVISE